MNSEGKGKDVGIVLQEEAPVVIKVYLTPEMEEMLDQRLARIEAQIGELRRMPDDVRFAQSRVDREYLRLVELTVQITAALDEVILDMLQMHLETCVAYALAEGDAAVLRKLARPLAMVLKQ